jgi:ribosomal protein S2
LFCGGYFPIQKVTKRIKSFIYSNLKNIYILEVQIGYKYFK